MKRIVIESPYAGDVTAHTKYAQLAVLDSLRRGETPYASHLLITQVFDDLVPEERVWGIHAGYAWYPGAELVAFYTDCGWSPGMVAARDVAVPKHDMKVELRTLPDDLWQQFITAFPERTR